MLVHGDLSRLGVLIMLLTVIHLLLLANRHAHLRPSLQLGPSIQQRKIRLPPNSHHPRKDSPVLHGHKREAEGRHKRPELARVDHASGYRLPDPVGDAGEGAAGEERLGAEEVGVERGGEDDLADDDLDGEGEGVGGVVEVVGEEHEPVCPSVSAKKKTVLQREKCRIV